MLFRSMMDQSRPGEPELPFFGVPAKTNTSFAAIWNKRPAPVVPVAIKRTNVMEFEMTFLPEVELEPMEDKSQQILEHSKLFNKIVEKIILTCPEQYFWVHDRFRIRREEHHGQRVFTAEKEVI